MVETLRQYKASGSYAERERFRFMLQLLPSMAAEEQRGVVQFVRRLQDRAFQLRATRELTSWVPGGVLLPLVDVVLKRSEPPGLAKSRRDTLRKLHPLLAPVQWDDSFGRIHGRQEFARRVDFLMGIARELPKRHQPPFLDQAFIVAEQTPTDVRASLAKLELAELVRGLSEPLRPRVRPLLASLPPSPSRNRAVTAWARTMRQDTPSGFEDFVWALQELSEPTSSDTPPPGERASALAWLASTLPASQAEQSLEVTLSTAKDDRLWIPIQMALAWSLPRQRRDSLLEQAFVRLTETTQQDREQILEALPPYLSDDHFRATWRLVTREAALPPLKVLVSLLKRTPTWDQSSWWLLLFERSREWPDQERWEGLAQLSRSLKPAQRARVVAAMSDSPDARERALTLGTLSRMARSRGERDMLRARSVNALSEMQSPEDRGRTFELLTSMVPRFALRSMVSADLFPEISLQGSNPRDPGIQSTRSPPQTDTKILEELKPLSPQERAALMRQMMHLLDDAPPDQDTPPEPVINLGFSERQSPDQELPRDVPLHPATDYLFWFEVGRPLNHSITAARLPLATEPIPQGAVITVVLFGFEDELEAEAGHDVGRLRLNSSGQAVVEQSSSPALEGSAPSRLFFPVRTPSQRGLHRLRCNILHQNTLLQSWLIHAEVGEGSPVQQIALRATQDFVYSRTLEPALLEQLPSPELTLILNGTEDTSHLFIFGDDIKEPLTFDTAELKGLVEQGRDRLAEATWGHPRPWNGQAPCRYGDGLDPERLRRDLVELAKTGWRFFSVLVGRLSSDKREEFRRSFLHPHSLQLALKESPQAVFPLALVYDYNIDTAHAQERFTLCPDFLSALEVQRPLEQTDCFISSCRHASQRKPTQTICPSGFWGFRHELGLTLSTPSVREPPTAIPYASPRHVAVGLSTDARLILRQAHVRKLCDTIQADWVLRDTRDDVLDLLRATQPHLVYFYCHGGIDPRDRFPYIQVGPSSGPGISRDNLVAYSIEWKQSRPLVFINGCHTTALEPEVALNLVSGFIENAQASGVLGTEITILEATARPFAEHCLQRLFAGATIGRAVRDARRALLQEGSPLGLVYIPFVLPGLRFAQAPMEPVLQKEAPAPIPA
ncbi:hypothetical protein HUA78_32590 [Myxococcus sp. CA033]|nr:hypothetical protein [Myxococcus sp. CA033]